MANLPFTINPEETFSLSINDTLYNFRQLWNTYGFWTLDIADSTGASLAYGVKIVTGIKLLQQYPKIPFELESVAVSDPTRNDLDEFILEVTLKDV